MYALKAAACLLAYWIVIHSVLRLRGIKFPLTGLRRKDRIAMYQLGFWRYIIFVWLVEYSVGVIIFAAAVHYFHYGAIGAFSLLQNAVLWLLTGLFIGVASYKSSEQY